MRAVLAVCLAFAFTLACFGALTFADAATSDLGTYYSEHFKEVLLIDDTLNGEPTNFKALRDSGDPEKLVVMQRIVKVANALSKLNADIDKNVKYNSTYKAGKNETLNESVVALDTELASYVQNTVKLNSDNFEKYDENGTILDKIKEYSKKYSAISEQYKLGDEYYKLFAVNENNPQGTAETVYGFYELDLTVSNYGAAALSVCYMKGLEEIAAADNPLEARETYVKKLNEVPKNRFEFIFGELLEINAYDEKVQVGEGEDKTDIDLTNNGLYNEYSKNKSAVEDFWSKASEEVKTAYAEKYALLQKYFDSTQEYNGAVESKNTAVIKYEVDGKTIMTVTAYIKDGYDSSKTDNKVATVFAPNASIKLYSSTLSGEAKKAGEAIHELNDKLNIGYLVRFNVYGGSSVATAANSKPFDVQKANDRTPGGVTYVIEFNVKEYYERIVAQDKGVIGSLLSQYVPVLSGVWGSTDKTSQIKDAYDLVKDGDTALCYAYENDELKPFDKITYSDGGILMLQTSSFGNFAIAAASDGTFAFLKNTMFWVVALAVLVVLIIVWAIIRKYKKYSVKFYSNGGSKVKNSRARKGGYFVMPDNPVRAGYVFAGWFEDKALTKRFIATRIVKRRRLKAYAKWTLEFTPERVNAYYLTLRNELASHAALLDSASLEEGKTKTFAFVEKGEKDIKLCLAFDFKKLKKDGYSVVASKLEETPTLFVIRTRDDYVVAQKLVAKLIETYALSETEYEAAADDETKFVLAVSNLPVVEEAVEEVVEETVEEITEEVAEEVVEEPAEETEIVVETEETEEKPVEEEVVEETSEEVDEVVEEVVEETEEVVEETVEEPASEEQLIEYFTKIRSAVCGYALYEMSEKAENGKMLVKLYVKEEAVYCYMALDPDSYGLETVGLGFSDTPALLKVACNADLDKAIELVEVLMTEHGFEKSDEPVEERPYEGKGFGYRIHFVEE